MKITITTTIELRRQTRPVDTDRLAKQAQDKPQAEGKGTDDGKRS